jgi:uncharacterized membrane protein YbhN (UPF0104 family)
VTGARLKKAIGLAVAAVILFFIVRSLAKGLAELGTYDLRVSGWRMVGAFAIFGLLFPIYGRIWQYILGKLGYGIGFTKSMRIWFLSQAGRYIPGKVWFALGRIYLCEREGIPKSITTVAMGLEIALVLGSAIVVFGLASAASPSLPGRPYVFGLWLVPVIIAGMHPRIVRAVLVRFRRLPVEFNMAYVDMLKLLGCYIVCWCIYGIGFYLIGTSLGLTAAPPEFYSDGTVRVIGEMTGVNALSWAGGLLSVVTPAGLGVREGISGVLLASIVERPYPSLIPLVARIWVTIAELGTIGILIGRKGFK